ncbi:potassium channel family protein [Polaromonas jejuensis]|uniref:Ion channel n=1 Tax=Polaromonas jejuensis TaxID=457502 RepID=A0ABW0QEU2_9BURK|nr:potassium channel family protein [Polaromonas jejuensis]
MTLAMLFIPAITITLISLCACIHYEALQRCNAMLPQLRLHNKRAKVLAAVGAAMVSHFLQIGLFAAALYFLQHYADLGYIGGNFKNTAFSFLYFSTETYTSLGFGDVFPLGHIRMVAGMEALTGLVMISWTASFTYLEMSRYWRPDSRKTARSLLIRKKAMTP